MKLREIERYKHFTCYEKITYIEETTKFAVKVSILDNNNIISHIIASKNIDYPEIKLIYDKDHIGWYIETSKMYITDTKKYIKEINELEELKKYLQDELLGVQ